MLDIEPIKIRYNNQDYQWEFRSYDPNECWSNVRTSEIAPTSIVSELNRIFVNDYALGMVGKIDGHKAHAILKRMGATVEDLLKPEFAPLLEFEDPRIVQAARSKAHFKKLPPAGHSPLNCKVLFDWVFSKWNHDHSLPATVGFLGIGPIPLFSLICETEARNLEPINLQLRTMPPPDCSDLVLGRERLNEEKIDKIIDLHEGRHLRIYSQEMFVLMLMTGRSVFQRPYPEADVFSAFRAGHPGLEFVSQGWRGWVESFVRYDRRTCNSGTSSSTSGSDNQVEESPLAAMGYHVGKTGLSLEQRRAILTAAFQGRIPYVESPSVNFDYMADWGEDGSAQRLRRIAKHLQRQIDNRRSFDEAKIEWMIDLMWLKETFYQGHMTFEWPKSSLG